MPPGVYYPGILVGICLLVYYPGILVGIHPSWYASHPASLGTPSSILPLLGAYMASVLCWVLPGEDRGALVLR